MWIAIPAVLIGALLGISGPSAASGAPDPAVQRLCGVLQGLPERRKAECCSTSSSVGLATACASELGRAVRDGAVSVDPADVDRCAADAAHALEGCDWVTPYLPAPPPSCRGIVRGRRAAGAACRSSLECRDGFHCAAGACAPPGDAGASCSGAPDPLTTAARQIGDARHPECKGYCFRGRCTAPVLTGGACAADQQCAAGTHCVAHRCVDGPRPTLGEPCDGSTCDGGLVCIAGRCAPPQDVGAPCTEPAACRATCVGATPDRPGTCATKCSAWPPAGYTQ
jgi:hypothetical protein